MTTPLDIVAAAVHAAQCGCPDVEQPAYDTAEVALNALTDERVVDHLVNALYRLGWGAVGEGTLEDMVRDAMRELGGA